MDDDIAEDFNNILTVILSYSESLLDAVGDPELRADVREIQDAGKRAAELTRQLASPRTRKRRCAAVCRRSPRLN